jgi:HSP20 family protein
MERRQVVIRYARTSGDALDSSLLEVVWEGFLPRALGPASFRPPVDVFETPELLLVTVEIAGVADDAYQVVLRDDVLIVTGERPWRVPPGEVHVHLSEIRYGGFRVEIELPVGIGVAGAKATYERGLLRIALAKEARPR